MSLYLEQGEIAPEQLHAPFEKALREGHLVPVCFVSARTGAGVAELLDVLAKLAAESGRGQSAAVLQGRRRRARSSSARSPIRRSTCSRTCSRSSIDPFVGKLGVFRVHQGTVTKDTQLFIGDGRKPFKVGHLFMLQGGKNVEIDARGPGRHRRGGQGRRDRVRLRAARFARRGPHPHAAARVPDADARASRSRPKKRGDEQRISDVLHRMIAEDPTLVVEHDPTTNETVLRGLGDLHLRSMLERMASQFKLEIDTRPPRIPYRETITAQGRGLPPAQEADRRRRPVRRGVAARRAAARAAPASSSSTQTKGGVIPHQFMPAVQKGVEQVLVTGAIAGFPLQDVRVIVYDGKHHPVDSKEVAFVSAGKKAFLDAIEKARPIVLEPIVSVEIICPEAQHRRHRRRPVVAARPGHRHARAAAGHARDQRPRAAGRARRLFGAAEVGDRRATARGRCSCRTTSRRRRTLQQQLATEFRKSRKHEED